MTAVDQEQTEAIRQLVPFADPDGPALRLKTSGP